LGYIVEIVPKAEKEFLKLSKVLRKNIRSKILSLEENPRLFGSKKLRETDYFRIRAGDYRIVYSIDDSSKKIKILSIAHRKDVYR
jgi:mRNA interferase RelE/StbE